MVLEVTANTANMFLVTPVCILPLLKKAILDTNCRSSLFAAYQSLFVSPLCPVIVPLPGLLKGLI